VDRLRELSIVTLTLPDLGRVSEFKAFVLGVHRTMATLQPVQRAETMWLPPQTADVLLCFPHNGLTVGLKGELRTEDHLQFRVSDGVCIPRRRSTRLQLCAPALVKEESGEVRACQTQDVSADGVTLEGAGALQVGQPVWLTVTLPEDGGAFAVEARVTERGEDDGVAELEFIGLDRDDRRRLTGFVTEQVRRRLNIVRSLQAEKEDAWH
jgi:hypothetical protein